MLSLGILVYLVLQIAIGAWVAKKLKSSDDYLLAGRSLGLGLATFSIFATWFGAETIMGSAAAIYEGGLSASRAEPFGYTLCLILMGFLIAGRLWAGRYTTIADLFKIRFGVLTEKLAIIIYIPTTIIWAAAQVRGFGMVLSTSIGMDATLAISVGAAVVILYSSLGGLLADVYTDFLQGIVLIMGLVVIVVVTVGEVGGVSLALSKIPIEKLTFLSSDESFLAAFDDWLIPVMGSLVAQEALSRVLASRSRHVAVGACYWAASLYILVGLIPVTLGLLGPFFNLEITEMDLFIPSLANKVLPLGLNVIFAGALISAILSTVDSTLLTVSALVSNNIIFPMRPHLGAHKRLWITRWVTIISGLLAFGFALGSTGIYEMIELASSLGTPGILVILLMGLWSKKGGEASGLAALIAGAVTHPIATQVFEFEAPFAASFLMAFLGFMAFSFGPLKHAVRTPALLQK